MPVLVRGKSSTICFFHIPKTGGTYVGECLQKFSNGKWIAATPDINRRHGLPRHFKVEFDVSLVTIRHPVEWHRSWWCWLQRTTIPIPENWHPLTDLWCFKGVTFDEYVDDVPEGFVGRLYREYATDRQIVIKTDQLTENLIAVLTDHRVQFDESGLRRYPRVNVSASWEVPEECARVILEKEREALKIWKRGRIVDAGAL